MSENKTGNREYKDNAFRLLFGNEIKSAELYNAIKGTDYAPNVLKMNTIQNPLYYGGLRNDVSFTIEDKFEFLQKHGGEIVSIMNMEWNWDDAKRVWGEEGREKGKEEIAVNLLDILDIETIAEKTKLSINRVRELKELHDRGY